MRMRHTSLRSMAMVERRTENFSIRSSTLDFFRIPAVSMKQNFPCSFSVAVDGVRVVPATLETMTRPQNAVDEGGFPTLGLPMTATLMTSSSSSSSSSGEVGKAGVQQVAGAVAVDGGDRDGIPRPRL